MKLLEASRNRFGTGLEDMVRHWETDSACLMEDLRTALHLGDWPRLLEGAHRLAGGAGVMGAVEVAELAQALEALARREIPRESASDSEADRLLHRLEQARERFLGQFSSRSVP